MPRFKISVARTVSETAEFYVDAESREDAEELYADGEYSDNTGWRAISIDYDMILDVEEI